ncbi:MAG: cryptochrome/photolyase family protein [Candidatus Nanopelagicales bacterium]
MRLLYISHDQLSLTSGILASANPESDVIVMVESSRLIESKKWHRGRLWFLLSAARHFAEELRNLGFQVHYVKAASTVAGIESMMKETGINDVHANEAFSHRLQENLQIAGITLHPHNFFLTSRQEFSEWAKTQKHLKMENFYRLQRKRLDVLMDGDEPVGGAWNFDKENRLPPPKNHTWPTPLYFELDDIDTEVLKEIEHLDLVGGAPQGEFSPTRTAALLQLNHFLKTSLNDFGPYEDCVPSDSWSVNHSLLSPYMNVGLLHPQEIIEKTLEYADEHDVSLSSLEGFIRQIIGWREYVNGVYWYFEQEYKNLNELGAKRELPEFFYDPAKTEMNCLSSTVSDVMKRGWVHHIPRLMILSNFATLAGIKPDVYLAWMREMFIDAADWVMVPNVIGMGVHADGGRMMTKPYISAGAYIKKMTNYCNGCVYNPGKRTGDEACPFTTLYWNFLDENKDTFSSNQRMWQQYSGLKRLSDIENVKDRAKEVFNSLDENAL